MTPESLLRRLRLQLTAAFLVVAAVGLSGLAATLVVTSHHYANARLDDRLQATASRAAALVFFDAHGRVRVGGVRDDSVNEGPQSVVVVRGADDVLLDPDHVGLAAVSPVVGPALRDAAEQGTRASATLDGRPVRLVALPWFRGTHVAGVVVAVQTPVSVASSPVFWPAIVGSVVLLLALTATMWLLTGRGLRPAFRAIDDREHFLATAAHELRGPLARLRAAAEAVRRDGAAHQQQADLGALIGLADSAGHVVSNLLLATRVEHAEMPVRREPVRLDRLLGDLELAHPDVVVDVREPVVVHGDPDLLRHALSNLVDNAARHAVVGDRRPTVVAAAFVDDGHAVLEVRDDGPGFPPGLDVLERYAAGPRGGTGLGLSLVAWIAEAHGARLELSSGPSTEPGARVRVVFAAAPDPRHHRVMHETAP